jgi:hypothetical protein
MTQIKNAETKAVSGIEAEITDACLATKFLDTTVLKYYGLHLFMAKILQFLKPH